MRNSIACGSVNCMTSIICSRVIDPDPPKINIEALGACINRSTEIVRWKHMSITFRVWETSDLWLSSVKLRSIVRNSLSKHIRLSSAIGEVYNALWEMSDTCRQHALFGEYSSTGLLLHCRIPRERRRKHLGDHTNAWWLWMGRYS